MALETDEIKKIIKAGTPDFIYKARKESKKLNTLVNGVDVPNYLSKVEGLESDDQFSLRKKFAGTIKHVFANLLRPIDKVFTATGGSRIYGTGNSAVAEKKLKEQLSDVSGGHSLRQWIENIQANKYYSDSAGVVFFEWNENDATPTIKVINGIRNYQSDGRDVVWILFEPEIRTNEDGSAIDGEFYRFVDDQKDYTFKKVGELIEELEDETFDNPWSRCPAIINSDIIDYSLTYAVSPLDNVVDLADKYLRGQSTRNIYEQLHMYPIFWMYSQKCESCKGSGETNGNVCKSCGGSKTSMKKDVSDALLLNTPTDAEAPTIAPNVAGYVAPELETFKESREELRWVGELMNFTMWGSTHEKTDNETATAAFLDLQPVHDRQGKFTDSFESLEKKMTDIIGEFYLKDSYNPDGTSINMGRRYQMENPDQIWEKYEKARAAKAPKSSLNHLLVQYYQSEFMNDVQSLGAQMKAMKVEPFIHSSDEEVKMLGVSDEDLLSKLYFNEFWIQLDIMDKLSKSPEQLKEGLNKFTTNKSIKDEESKNLQGGDRQREEG